ncbi:hypothetical protein GGR51DRAFT_573656 [Nemania sp. FL0031]|nr:hypothetical protein GGR51DRAFT_573656 [Nemania sp. FL0031]
MITEGVRDFSDGMNTPPERVPTASALAAFPPPAQFVESAAAGRTMLGYQAATRYTGAGVHGGLIVGDLRELVAGLLDQLVAAFWRAACTYTHVCVHAYAHACSDTHAHIYRVTRTRQSWHMAADGDNVGSSIGTLFLALGSHTLVFFSFLY